MKTYFEAYAEVEIELFKVRLEILHGSIIGTVVVFDQFGDFLYYPSQAIVSKDGVVYSRTDPRFDQSILDEADEYLLEYMQNIVASHNAGK